MNTVIGRPPTTLLKATSLQAMLLKRFPAGTTFSRADWDSIIVMSCNVGINQAANITRTGEAARLWVRHIASFKENFVELLPAGPQIMAMPAAAAVAMA